MSARAIYCTGEEHVRDTNDPGGTTLNNGPVFVGGTGRSGTTLVVWLLGMSENMACFTWETQFIVSNIGLPKVVAEGQRALPEFMRNMRGRWFRRSDTVNSRNVRTIDFLDDIKGELGTRFDRGGGEFDAGMSRDIAEARYRTVLDAFESDILAARTEEDRLLASRRLVRALGRELTASRGKNRWVEKTPKNLIAMDFILRLLPDAKIINCIRDGRDVVTSILANQFWPVEVHPDAGLTWDREINIHNASRFWERVLRYGLKVGRPTSSYFELRYEDLVENPEQELRRLCEFLGEPFCDRWLEVEYRRTTIGKWKQAFSEDDKHTFKENAGDLLVELGYEPGPDW